MIIRVSFLLVASSFALLKIVATKSNFPRKRMKSLAPGCDELEETENSTANAAYLMNQNEEKHMNEKEILQNLVENYKQREMILQRKLLQLNLLKEEQSAIAELQIQLKKKNAKFNSLNETITSLEAENKTTEEKVREDGASKKHLEIAKKMLNEMERKKSFEGRRVEEQILMLEQQVTELQKKDSSTARDAKMIKKLKDVEGVKLEAFELKRRNKELQLEKREIGFKLVTADVQVKTQEETVALIKEEITGLRRVHEELLEQVERLQRNRFEMVEEVVYQRWLFACLRFELNNHRQKKVTRERNCIKNNLEESYDERDKIALTYEYNDPELESNNSSNTTTLDDDDETETETETTTLDESSSSSQSSSSKSSTKRWRKTKHYYSKENNVISSPAMQKSLKRVSFGNCSVKPCNNQDASKADEKVTDDKEIRDFLENKQENRTEHKTGLDAAVSNSDKSCNNEDVSEANEKVTDDRDFLENKKENRTEQLQELDAAVNKLYSQEDARGSGSMEDNCWKDFTTEKEIRLEMVTRQELRAKLVGLVQLVAIIFFSLLMLQACFKNWSLAAF